MKYCQNCNQSVADEITICPACGGEVGEGRKYIDDYRIVKVIHEGYATFFCQAIRERTGEHVMIRLFMPQAGVDENLADRLKSELEKLKKIPLENFVRHHAIRRSSDGLWYRISEWIDHENWGDLISSGRLSDLGVAFKLFSKIAAALDLLHEKRHFIPHLIIDDIMVIQDESGELDIKIDYKLSRFFDPKLDRPGPMLKHLLECHPDIINGRPFDFRTDIWSLGKVFMELLTADYESSDFLPKVDELSIPNEIKVLLKTMLAKEPDLRPRTMREVADVFSRITPHDIEKAQRDHRKRDMVTIGMISRLRKRQKLLAAVVCFLIVTGGVVWYQIGFKKKESDLVLEDYANRYAPSVAIVLVEYWLKSEETIYYHTKVEGTAFLVDAEGYLMTNRHVACPWLEDVNLFLTVYQLRQNGISPSFGFRMFLWFAGERAFNRSAALIDSPDMADAYFLDTAFRTDGSPRLTIAGVARPLVNIRQIVASPLKDDFAVLKIEKVPAGLKPLPLDTALEPQKIPKLSKVITLGFPMGSQGQSAKVNVSVARGHIRRTFDDLIQVDASIYGGSSGGPLIDVRGKVIGIASGVALARTPVVKPIWNMAMVLPITKAVTFLENIKIGQMKWNGVLDLSVEAKIEEISDIAFRGNWAEAVKQVDEKLEQSSNPSLVMTGGIIHFCANDFIGAKRYFLQALSVDPENQMARLMLLVIDWQAGRFFSSTHRHELLALDWRSPSEFLGYLAQVLSGRIDEKAALKEWVTGSEKSWLYYIVGLIHVGRGELPEAERLMQQAITAADESIWAFYLARAKLAEIREQRLSLFKNKGRWEEYQKAIESFDQDVLKSRETKTELRKKIVEFDNQLGQQSIGPVTKREILEKLLELTPDNREILVDLAFYCAMDDKWEKALQYARMVLKNEGRENAGRLSIGLLHGELLKMLGHHKKADAAVEDFLRKVRDPWYRAMGECLLGKRDAASLTEMTKENPENLVTVHAALGLWAEGRGKRQEAIADYKIALESFMDNWIEFGFARERITRLRDKEK